MCLAKDVPIRTLVYPEERQMSVTATNTTEEFVVREIRDADSFKTFGIWATYCIEDPPEEDHDEILAALRDTLARFHRTHAADAVAADELIARVEEAFS